MDINIKKVVASSYKECEDTIKRDVSGEYKIVDSESKRKWGIIGPKFVEVSYLDLSNQTIKNNVSDTKANDDIEKVIEDKMNGWEEKINDLFLQMNSVMMMADKDSNDALSQVKEILVKNGVDSEVAQSIINDVMESQPKGTKLTTVSEILYELKDVLTNAIHTCEGYDSKAMKTIMLVGPTGVGKTTTLAKLASELYDRNKDVGLITLDTFRMGAVEQLRSYADILGFDIESCKDKNELRDVLLKFMDKDSVLIDTTGQNQKNIVVDEELKEMCNLANPDQLSLVLSATTKTGDLYDCIDKFSVLDVNTIIMTKLDETNSMGEIINVAYRYPHIKLAYFTTGQEVPSDIEAAKSEKIIKAITTRERG